LPPGYLSPGEHVADLDLHAVAKALGVDAAARRCDADGALEFLLLLWREKRGIPPGPMSAEHAAEAGGPAARLAHTMLDAFAVTQSTADRALAAARFKARPLVERGESSDRIIAAAVDAAHRVAVTLPYAYDGELVSLEAIRAELRELWNAVHGARRWRRRQCER